MSIYGQSLFKSAFDFFLSTAVCVVTQSLLFDKARPDVWFWWKILNLVPKSIFLSKLRSPPICSPPEGFSYRREPDGSPNTEWESKDWQVCWDWAGWRETWADLKWTWEWEGTRQVEFKGKDWGKRSHYLLWVINPDTNINTGKHLKIHLFWLPLTSDWV